MTWWQWLWFPRQWRFGALNGKCLVAFSRGRKRAMIIRFEDVDERWHCYCNDMELLAIADDLATFECDGSEYQLPVKIVPEDGDYFTVLWEMQT